ncbi:MAG: flagellar hook-basal body complex protein FliE [Burkholderiales bacterium]|nr:MAG: flagellar hook-basal body complex protein FliE [Burkholderiales bacterium]
MPRNRRSTSCACGRCTVTVDAVCDTRKEAQVPQRQCQVDSDSVSLEQTMVAMQKSQIAFQAALKVRNRLVAAYADIMNMQV